MLPGVNRTLLHRQAARWLEQQGEKDAAVLAHQFQQGGDLFVVGDWQTLLHRTK